MIPVMCFAVVHRDGVVVFETGMNPEVRRDPIAYWGPVAKRVLEPLYPDGADVIARLEQAGVALADVRYVVNSHLHNDHAGMNRYFPDATVVVRAREFAHAVEKMDQRNTGYLSHDFTGNDATPQTIEYEETYDVFGDGTIELVSTIGHTPGHQSLRVCFPSGRAFVLSGDALYQRSSLCNGHPPGILWDRAAAESSVRKLAGMQDQGDTVLVNHDPDDWAECTDTLVLHHEG
jgi:glyoxylase-like metal-dependent hydrolase (beta-lactamase superfamily II)